MPSPLRTVNSPNRENHGSVAVTGFWNPDKGFASGDWASTAEIDVAVNWIIGWGPDTPDPNADGGRTASAGRMMHSKRDHLAGRQHACPVLLRPARRPSSRLDMLDLADDRLGSGEGCPSLCALAHAGPGRTS
jgi:hypothetical protein